MADLNAVVRRRARKLLDKRNVVAVGIGEKVTGGLKTGRPAIVVSVERKQNLAELSGEDQVPREVDGAETDVIETGPIRALAETEQQEAVQEYTDRRRPAVPGLSIGHKEITAGTFGCVVTNDAGNVFVLSNNHVLAASNAAALDDEILQPGPHDGGTLPNDVIARLHEFVPIQFDGPGGGDDGPPSGCRNANAFARIANGVLGLLGRRTRIRVYETQAVNRVDAAIARPVSPSLIHPEVIGLGRLTGSTQPAVGEPVHKSGRTTETTHGEVSQVNVTARVQYGAGRTATFEGQAVVTSSAGPFSQGGDSGSAVVDDENRFVGLLFAGSDQITLINPAADVLEAFGVEPL